MPKHGRKIGDMDSSLQYVVSKLHATKGHWRSVAQGSGVSIRTFSKIAQGKTKDPRHGTVERLERYFRQQDQSIN